MTVVETGAASTPTVGIRPRGISRRERWQRRLPLLPALIYVIVVTQIPFVVTLWYSFQSYFLDIPGRRALQRAQQLQLGLHQRGLPRLAGPLGGHDRRLA